MSFLVKYKLGAAAVVVALAFIFFVINQIERRTKAEVDLETVRSEQQVREKIDEATRSAPRNVDDALEWLRLRQERRNN
jgi:uncharacterized protein YoxC